VGHESRAQQSTIVHLIYYNIWNRLSPGSGGRIQPPRPKIATNPQKSGTVRHERWVELLQKRGQLRHMFLFNGDTCVKNEGFIVYEFLWRKNLLRFLQFHLHLAETAPAKSGLKQEKPGNLKKEAERWLRFSQLVAPVKNMEEVFFLQPILNKKTLSVF
jgi:hypothetical protein